MARVVKIRRHPFGRNFLAINMFGVIFTRDDLSPVELNHELIHTAQQRELLYLPFYLWYVVEWAVLCVKCCDRMKAYFNIRFEQEAYRHQSDLNYLKHRKHYRYK